MNQMSNEEKLAKMKEILTEDYVKELIELETPADVQESLRGKGVELSEEEIVTVRDLIVKMIEDGVDELSEEELESVAGGVPEALLLAGIAGCALLIVGAIVCSVFLRTRW